MVQLAIRRALRVCPAALLAAAVILPAAAMAQDASAPAPTPAPAQGQAPAAAAPAPAQGQGQGQGQGPAQVQLPPDTKWVKICGEEPTAKKQMCQVIQQLTAQSGQFIASVNIQTLEGEPKMVLAAAMRMPTTGVLVAPGMRAQIDTGKQYEVKYSICFPEVCYADMQIDDAFITAMKAGGQLNLIALTQQSQQAKPISIGMTLVGFTKAFDGEGIDPAAAQAMRNDLAKSLKEHADEARQKLLEQQKASTEAPAQ